MSLENHEEVKQEVLLPVRQMMAEEGGAEDGNIRERIRQLVVDALVKREADPQAVKAVMQSAMDGIGEGLGQRAQQAGDALKEAVTGLDEAIGRTVYAVKQAMDESLSQGRQFAQSDLKETYDSLKGLEEEFLRVMKATGEKTQGAARDEFEKLRAHLTNTGSDTGRQAKEVLETLGNRLNASATGSAQEAKEAAQEASGRLRAVASGILRGLADVLDKR